MQIVVGIDEVGRGCLVGAVVASAVILDPKKPIIGLTDSKKLTEKRRLELSKIIKRDALAWAIARAEPSEIDEINILQASLLAMKRAFDALNIEVTDATWVKVDGNKYPPIDCAGETIIKGDLTEAEISAASILAKVSRDAEMHVLDQLYPNYNFAKHKGYATKLHLEKLLQLGVTPLHRKSFSPVRKHL